MRKYMCVTTAMLSVQSLTMNAQADIRLELAFDTLPSEQGWTYFAAGNQAAVIETDAYAVDGVALSQTTVGDPVGIEAGAAEYELDLTGMHPIAWTLEFRARITADQVGNLTHWGYRNSVLVEGRGAGVGLSMAFLSPIDQSTMAHNATAFHDYRIDADILAGTYTISVDDAQVYSGPMSSTSAARANFGDGTGTDNANAETTEWSLTLITCLSDLTGDAVVDGADLAILLAAWGVGPSPADLNGDNVVDGADLAAMLATWGPC